MAPKSASLGVTKVSVRPNRGRDSTTALLSRRGKVPLQDILTPQRVHLLGGVSDAGKTRFLLPAMVAWQTAPPWVYVVGDRTLADAKDTLQDMGINPATLNILPAFGADNKSSWLEIKIAVDRQFPSTELIIVEGFQDLCPGSGQKREVREFLSTVCADLEPAPGRPMGRIVWGVVESPKLKPNEKYPNPRQRISGPSGWGYHGSSILLIEDADKKEQFLGPERIMWVCEKGKQRRKINGCFTMDNRLVFPAL